MDIRYPARLTPDPSGGFCVQFIDLEEAFTEGDSLEEALFYASDVLTLTLQGRMEEEAFIPTPSTCPKDAYLVAPDAKTQAALLLRHARGDRTYADLARALHTSWDVAKRLEDPNHWPSLRSLDRAAAVMGKRLVLSFA